MYIAYCMMYNVQFIANNIVGLMNLKNNRKTINI